MKAKLRISPILCECGTTMTRLSNVVHAVPAMTEGLPKASQGEVWLVCPNQQCENHGKRFHSPVVELEEFAEHSASEGMK